MVRAFAIAALALVSNAAVSCAAVAAVADESPLLSGRSVAVSSCDHVAPVCGVMSKDRLVPYDSECSARADGAVSVVFGGCFDQN